MVRPIIEMPSPKGFSLASIKAVALLFPTLPVKYAAMALSSTSSISPLLVNFKLILFLRKVHLLLFLIRQYDCIRVEQE